MLHHFSDVSSSLQLILEFILKFLLLSDEKQERKIRGLLECTVLYISHRRTDDSRVSQG